MLHLEYVDLAVVAVFIVAAALCIVLLDTITRDRTHLYCIRFFLMLVGLMFFRIIFDTTMALLTKNLVRYLVYYHERQESLFVFFHALFRQLFE